MEISAVEAKSDLKSESVVGKKRKLSENGLQDKPDFNGSTDLLRKQKHDAEYFS